MDGKYSHWLSGKFTPGLLWVKRKPPLLQNEFSLFKSCQGLLCSSHKLYLWIQVWDCFFSYCLRFERAAPPTKLAIVSSSPETMCGGMRVRSGRVVSD